MTRAGDAVIPREHARARIDGVRAARPTQIVVECSCDGVGDGGTVSTFNAYNQGEAENTVSLQSREMSATATGTLWGMAGAISPPPWGCPIFLKK